MDFLNICATFLGVCGILGIVIAVPLDYLHRSKQIRYEKWKLEQESQTNKLALAYKILSERPEVTIEQVQQLVDQDLIIEDQNGYINHK